MNSFDPYHEWLGIPPERQPPDHYVLLGLRRFEADPSVIETAAESRMSHVRSFQTGPRGHFVGDLLNQVATARRVLLDPHSRLAYDRHQFPSPDPRPVPPPPPPPRTPTPPPPPEPVALGIRAERRAVGGRQRSWPWVMSVVVLLGVSALAWGVASGWASGRGDAVPPEPVELVPTPEPEPVEPVVVRQEGDGSVHLTAAVAELRGESLERRQDEQQHHVTGWRTSDDQVSWQFHLTVPGIFRADLTYSVTAEQVGTMAELLLDGEVKETFTLRAADDDRFLTDQGFLAVPRSGAHRLHLRLVNAGDESTFRLRDVRLVPKLGGTANRPGAARTPDSGS